MSRRKEDQSEDEVVIDKEAVVTRLSQDRRILCHFYGLDNVNVFLSAFRHDCGVVLVLSLSIAVLVAFFDVLCNCLCSTGTHKGLDNSTSQLPDIRGQFSFSH